MDNFRISYEKAAELDITRPSLVTIAILLFIVPSKGEKGEKPWDSAAREAKEEAGVLGNVSPQPLTTFWFERPKRSTRELVTAYLLEVVVDKVVREAGRKPKWWTLERALEKVTGDRRAA